MNKRHTTGVATQVAQVGDGPAAMSLRVSGCLRPDFLVEAEVTEWRRNH